MVQPVSHNCFRLHRRLQIDLNSNIFSIFKIGFFKDEFIASDYLSPKAKRFTNNVPISLSTAKTIIQQETKLIHIDLYHENNSIVGILYVSIKGIDMTMSRVFSVVLHFMNFA